MSPTPALGSLTDALEVIAKRYPTPLIEGQLADIPRIAFHIELVRNLTKANHPVIADIGGGIGLFSPGLRGRGNGRDPGG
jgi:hypothetical protein